VPAELEHAGWRLGPCIFPIDHQRPVLAWLRLVRLVSWLAVESRPSILSAQEKALRGLPPSKESSAVSEL
jgi:hypothetical protein